MRPGLRIPGDRLLGEGLSQGCNSWMTYIEAPSSPARCLLTSPRSLTRGSEDVGAGLRSSAPESRESSVPPSAGRHAYPRR
jgi:hypothetical protein